MINRGDRPWLLLDAHVRLAVLSQPPEVALKLATLMDEGAYRLQISCGLDADGEPDPHTLTYIVEVPCADGDWAGICSVHHSRLDLPWPEVLAEVECLRWQHGLVPDDVSSLTDSPPA